MTDISSEEKHRTYYRHLRFRCLVAESLSPCEFSRCQSNTYEKVLRWFGLPAYRLFDNDFRLKSCKSDGNIFLYRECSFDDFVVFLESLYFHVLLDECGFLAYGLENIEAVGNWTKGASVAPYLDPFYVSVFDNLKSVNFECSITPSGRIRNCAQAGWGELFFPAIH